MELTNTIRKEDLPEMDDFSPIPAGDYNVVITKADLKNTKSGEGNYINLSLKVEGGEFNGKNVFSMITIRNKSTIAEEIGHKNLNSLMSALNLEELCDTDQLLGGQLAVSVKIKEASDGYDAKNEIKSYKKIDGVVNKVAVAPKKSMQTENKAKPAWLSK